MRKLFTLLAAALGTLAVPAAAEAAEGFVTGDVNLRAGPSTDYPRIAVVPRGSQVEVYGCLPDYRWCDVGVYRWRGWMSSRYLSIFYDGPYYRSQPIYRVPSITFGFGYWDRWYRDEPWYPDWRWRWQRPPRPRVDPPIYGGRGGGWVPGGEPNRNDRPRRNDGGWVPGGEPNRNVDRPRRNDGGGWVGGGEPPRRNERPQRDWGGGGGGGCDPGSGQKCFFQPGGGRNN